MSNASSARGSGQRHVVICTHTSSQSRGIARGISTAETIGNAGCVGIKVAGTNAGRGIPRPLDQSGVGVPLGVRPPRLISQPSGGLPSKGHEACVVVEAADELKASR